MLIILLALIGGCSQILASSSPLAKKSGEIDDVAKCSQLDSFEWAVNKAVEATALAQTAQSAQDWNKVVLSWIQAIEGMQAVPLSSPKKAFAQKKVIEYQNNLEIAQKQALAISIQLPFPTFNSQFLDKQLLLYLSYVTALGKPDILIIGSSRAVQGVDPKQLETALASKGKPGLKVFNFSVNGATAQVVDFMLQKLIATEQMPRLILWADGVRAFNSGRVDRTYSGIISSPGYQNLLKGNAPNLPLKESKQGKICKEFSQISLHHKASNWLTSLSRSKWAKLMPWSMEAAFAAIDLNAIDANGFLPSSARFNPATYFQSHPRVAGLYDGDYQNFNLGGKQAEALSRVVSFARQKQIPLVFVNLPLTQTYLDSTRQKAEQQFVQVMQQLASQQNFVFLDLGRIWLNQNSYFADPSHLNRYGAVAVSNLLAEQSSIPWP